MTLARKERTDNFKLALKTLLDVVGALALDEVLFDPNAYQDILKTTWEELQVLDLVEILAGQYLLTGVAGRHSLLTTGLRDQNSFRVTLSDGGNSSMRELIDTESAEPPSLNGSSTLLQLYLTRDR